MPFVKKPCLFPPRPVIMGMEQRPSAAVGPAGRRRGSETPIEAKE